MISYEALTFDDVALLPVYSNVNSRSDVKTEVVLLNNAPKAHTHYRMDIPLIASPMKDICQSDMANALGKLGTFGIIHRFQTIQEQVAEIVKVGSKYIKAAAIGVNDDYMQRAEALCYSGTNILCFDVANGYTTMSVEALKNIRKRFADVYIIGANICTKEGFKAISPFCNAIRVNVGAGSVCSTRIQTGVGTPQLTALRQCYRQKQRMKSDCLIICDGGISKPGDLCKALAAGANFVMSGRIFAGTFETPGQVWRDPSSGLRYKEYNGSASFKMQKQRGILKPRVEGISTKVQCKFSVDEIVNYYMNGLQSSMSYLNAFDLRQYRDNARFVKVTYAGQIQARPHILLERE